jgi:DNA-binding winged helix-turn-helix (wHTH) protein
MGFELKLSLYCAPAYVHVAKSSIALSHRSYNSNVKKESIARDGYAQRARTAPMHVRLLGPFLVEIDRRAIEWLRRRDKQVFKYIVLSSERTVSRAELTRLFWHGAERDHAAQSLRTVCSNIRKAIGAVVGSKNVEEYFRAGEYISIDVHNVVVDVERFTTHADAGDAEYERGRLRAAYAHYRSAVALYHGDLLVGDRNERWMARQARALKSRHAIAGNRIAQMVATIGHRAADEEGLADLNAPPSALDRAQALTFVLDMYAAAGVEPPLRAGVLEFLASELIRADLEEQP